jgi:SAM-dependent methyltransferase
MVTAPPATDWDAYYRTPAAFAPITRRITERAILRDVSRFAAAPATMLELGGGNSGCLGALRRRFPDARLIAIDTNALGLRLLQERMPGDAKLTVLARDIFEPLDDVEAADVVFSVGLIEHFDPDGTARAIRAHFARVKPGGLVIITFPTRTWLYQTTRRLAELAGVWAFPDERPLDVAEVAGEVARHGDILDVRINWPIVLTQGNVSARSQVPSLQT